MWLKLNANFLCDNNGVDICHSLSPLDVPDSIRLIYFYGSIIIEIEYLCSSTEEILRINSDDGNGNDYMLIGENSRDIYSIFINPSVNIQMAFKNSLEQLNNHLVVFKAIEAFMCQQ